MSESIFPLEVFDFCVSRYNILSISKYPYRKARVRKEGRKVRKTEARKVKQGHKSYFVLSLCNDKRGGKDQKLL